MTKNPQLTIDEPTKLLLAQALNWAQCTIDSQQDPVTADHMQLVLVEVAQRFDISATPQA